MKTSTALKAIYDEAEKKLGHEKARKYLTTFFSSMIFDLKEANELTPAMIERKISEELNFVTKANKEKVA